MEKNLRYNFLIVLLFYAIRIYGQIDAHSINTFGEVNSNLEFVKNDNLNKSSFVNKKMEDSVVSEPIIGAQINKKLSYVNQISNLLVNTSSAGVLGANLWLKANKGVTTNSSSHLTDWVDQTAINDFFAIGVIGLQNNALNFNPVVAINNTNSIGSTPSNRLVGDQSITIKTIYAVLKTNSQESNMLGSTAVGSTYGPAFFAYASGLGNKVHIGNGDDGAEQSFSDPTPSKYSIRGFDLNGDPGSYMLDGLYGSLSGPNKDEVTITPMVGGTNNNGVSFGWAHFKGDVAEIITFNSALSSVEKYRIESYLAIKYGISLGNNTIGVAYVNSSGAEIWTANPTYIYDIFGIGKDDVSELNQPQSNSTNTGSGDGSGQSGKGNIVLSNPSSLDNGDFLLIGHDNGALTEQSSDLPLSQAGAKRIGREWKVSHTNDVGSVTLKFSTLGLTISGASVNDFKLLIDTDGNGDFTDGLVTEVNPTSFSGNLLTFDNVTFPHDAVFTFVTNPASAPGGIIGANLWLKSNEGVTNSGSDLTAWTDQTGTNSFTKQGSIGYTTNAINFNPAVSFNNTNSNTTLPLIRLDGNTPINYVDGFAVFKSNANQSTLVGGTNPGSAYGVAIFSVDGSPTSIFTGNGSFNTYQRFVNPQISQFGITNLDVSLSTSPFATGRLNGLSQVMLEGSGGDFSNISFTPMIGGSNNNGSSNGWYPFNGEVTEIVLFPNSLSLSDKIKVESYLAVKYGITLDASVTNYVSSSGTSIWSNTSYWHDVFGIGKDTLSALNQTQSNSINTGSGDGTGQSGKGNVLIKNPSSLDNGDFLMIGNDGTPLVEQLNDMPSSLSMYRLTREWKVQRTGDVGTVDLEFDFNGLSTTGGTTDVNNYRLLIDEDGDGDFTTGTVTQITPNAFGSPKLIFNGVSLPNGSVFTFATGIPPNAVDDTLAIVSGSSSSQSVLDNDTMVGSPASNTNIILSQVSSSNTGISLDTATGLVDVAAGTSPGSYTLVYRICDITNNSNCDDATVTVNVSSLFVDVKGDIHQIVKGGEAVGDLFFNDYIIPNAQLVSWQYYNASGTLVSSTNFSTPVSIYDAQSQLAGTISMRSDGGYDFISAANYLGTVPLFYTLKDNNLSIGRASLTIEVLDGFVNGNNPPVAQDDAVSTGKGRTINSSLLINDSDLDGNPLNVSLSDIPLNTASTIQGYNLFGALVNAGQLTIRTDGSYTFVPDAGFEGATVAVNYTISDGNGGTNTANLKIAVYPDASDNYYPTDDARVVKQGVTITGDVKLNDIVHGSIAYNLNSAYDEGNAITLGSPNVIANVGTLTINTDGTYQFVPEAQFKGTLALELIFLESTLGYKNSTLYLTVLPSFICYKPGVIVGGELDSKVGITALGRAGAEQSNWPMVRKGAWLVLEAKTKGFVVNRLTDAQISSLPASDLVEGMIVYNITQDCLQINVDGTATGWKCFNTQTCPD